MFSRTDRDTSRGASDTSEAQVYGRSVSLIQNYRNEYFVEHSEKSKERRAPTLKEEVFAALSADPTLSTKALARTLQRPMNSVRFYRTEYFTLYPEKRPPAPIGKIEQAVRRLLAENPGDTPSQIARRAHCATSDVKRVLARVEGVC